MTSLPPLDLPARPSLEHLRNQAKARLAALRATQPSARLADAQLALAREYGFESWATLVRTVTARASAVSAPRITAPVSRVLGTRDLARAVAFWREVLGFAVHSSATESGAVELVSGAARISLGASDWSPDGAGGAQPPGTAIVFFETSDVAGMREAVAARGGAPSPIEKANGIKMQLFQVRDPDGHTLWFGQSYQVETPARPQAMVYKGMPELPFDDVPSAVRHYREVLGFTVNYEQPDIGVMDRDRARVLLIARTPAHRGIGSAFFYIRDADELYAELLERGADIEDEPVSRPWGIREFVVRDAEGNRLTFGQTFE